MIRANTFSFDPFSYRNHHPAHLPTYHPLSYLNHLPVPCITSTTPGAKMRKQLSESKLSRLLHSGLANCNQYGANADLWTDLNLAHYTGNRVVRIRRAQALGKSLCADCPMLRLCAEMAIEPQSAAWQGVILAGVPVLGEDRTQQYRVAMESIRMVAAGETVDAAHRHQETYYLDQLMKAQLTIKKNGKPRRPARPGPSHPPTRSKERTRPHAPRPATHPRG